MVTLRAMEYILSFILVPYLLRVLGPAQYGAIAFMQGIIGYFSLCINYGFPLIAPRDIAHSVVTFETRRFLRPSCRDEVLVATRKSTSL